jgi:toxin ParE1/3/4
MLKIERTDRADEDLIDIWIAIARHNASAANEILDSIENRWQQLSRYPYSGVTRDDIAPGIRHLVAGVYLTLYRVKADSIEIVRVLHGRRKIDEGMV